MEVGEAHSQPVIYKKKETFMMRKSKLYESW